MTNYADFLNVIWVYSHTPGGSTVRPTMAVTALSCVHLSHPIGCTVYNASLLKPMKILLQKLDIFKFYSLINGKRWQNASVNMWVYKIQNTFEAQELI